MREDFNAFYDIENKIYENEQNNDIYDYGMDALCLFDGADSTRRKK